MPDRRTAARCRRAHGRQGRVERWFSTSKVPLRDADGRTVRALPAVTRDVTEQRRTEAELVDSRNLLNYAVEGMSDGLAMFERTGRLVYRNGRYRGDVSTHGVGARSPGRAYPRYPAQVVETGEQLGIARAGTAGSRSVVRAFRVGGEDRSPCSMAAGCISGRAPRACAAAMVVVSDMTTLEAGRGRAAFAHQPAQGAGRNRWPHRPDEPALARRPPRGGAGAGAGRTAAAQPGVFSMSTTSRPTVQPLGHLAGDECLKPGGALHPGGAAAQGGCAGALWRRGIRRHPALATDEDAAFRVADQARLALQDLKLPRPRQQARPGDAERGPVDAGRRRRRREPAAGARRPGAL